jgi:hypothetical protein
LIAALQPRWARRGGVWAALAAVLLCGTLAVATDNSEDSVKAAYLYKFLSYAEWPSAAYADPQSPHVIGVLGADALFSELERVVTGRRVNGRPVLARLLRAGDPLEGLHILHLGRSASPLPAPETLAGKPVLVVTDLPAPVDEISALNFVTIDRKVRFEAAPRAAERSGLKLSARLLLVAERVYP